MRMWGIHPNLLCRQHLLGEHSEIHKHRHNFVKKHSITKRISPMVQIEPENMKKRHDELVKEMIARGYNHNSPYEQPDLSHLKPEERYATIDTNNSILDLAIRCPECSNRIKNEIDAHQNWKLYLLLRPQRNWCYNSLWCGYNGY